MTDAITLRSAGPADAPLVAHLHADSWRRHYRGAYADSFLDGEVDADRSAEWSRRLAAPGDTTLTIVAERSGDAGAAVVGFAHVAFDADPVFGALLDNLHVDHRIQRQSLGTRLMAAAGRAVAGRGTGMFLWVLEQNVRAQAFYLSLGGHRAGSREIGDPGGVPGRLSGSPTALRMAWTDVHELGGHGTNRVTSDGRPDHTDSRL